MRAPHRVRAIARRATAGSSPQPVAMRSRGAELDEQTVRGVLELALRVGEAMLSLGAPAADVTGSVRAVVRAFGLVGCQVDLTFTAITVSYDPGPAAPAVTLMRVVGERVPDYGRLARVTTLAQRLGAAPVAAAAADAEVAEAHQQLDEILTRPHPLSRWLVSAVLALMAGAVAVLLGGGLGVAGVAAATTALIDRTLFTLGRRGLPPFFLQAVGAAIATSVAVLLLLVVPELPVTLEALPPSLVVASGIVVLLAGMSLVGAAEDAIAGFPVTAGGRTFEVLVLTLGIVVGIGAVLDLARRWGVPLEVIDVPPPAALMPLQILAAAVISGAWALASYATVRATALAAAVGALGWIILGAAGVAGAGPAVASATAAVVIGFLAEAVSRRWGVPALVTSVCGIVPLLPGLAIYRGLFQVVNSTEGTLDAGIRGLLGAAMVGLALAAGVTLGEYLASALRSGRQQSRSLVAQHR